MYIYIYIRLYMHIFIHIFTYICTYSCTTLHISTLHILQHVLSMYLQHVLCVDLRMSYVWHSEQDGAVWKGKRTLLAVTHKYMHKCIHIYIYISMHISCIYIYVYIYWMKAVLQIGQLQPVNGNGDGLARLRMRQASNGP